VTNGKLEIGNFQTADADKLNVDLLTTDAAATDVTGNLPSQSGHLYFLAGVTDVENVATTATDLSAAATWANTGASAQTNYFVVADADSSAVYKWVDAANSADEVAATELSLVGTVDAVLATTDLLFA
jgi:hypothetical protein